MLLLQGVHAHQWAHSGGKHYVVYYNSSAIFIETCSFIVPQCYVIFYRSLSSIPAPRLGALAIEEALKRAAVEKDSVDEVYMGNVLPASMGQAPDRQACIFAGIK